jgi:homoserine trans-succinylase
MNITVPIDVGRHLKGIKNVSAFIAQTLRDRFAREEEEKMRLELGKAYKENAEEALQIAKEWESTLGDGL